MRGVEPSAWRGTECLRKVYPHAETAQFKCYGSGYRNEGLLPPPVAAFVPDLLASTSDPTQDVSYLECLSGQSLPATELDHARARSAGARLATIHDTRGHWFGSLDQSRCYDRWAESWIPRWQVMTGLVARLDADLAEELTGWGLSLLSVVHDGSPPALVHGDFGPANLLWPSDRDDPWVLDWEHARYGHPAEDLAKMRLAELFPEPNGFRLGDRSMLPAVEAEWRRLLPVPAWPAQLDLLLAVYFAGTLGVFLDAPPWPRLAWLRSAVRAAQ